MVRAFDIFHFEGQEIETIPKPKIIVPASNNRLLFSRKPHSLEFYNIPDSGVVKEFPVLNSVVFMIHCSAGDYIATIENGQIGGQSVNMCRVYTNWYSNSRFPPLDENCINQIRKRFPNIEEPEIDKNYIDVIEISNDESVSAISCCQNSGKLVVCSAHRIYIHKMSYCKSKSSSEYIDFQRYPFYLSINFVPVGLNIVENILTLYRMDRIITYELDVEPVELQVECGEDEKNDEIDEMYLNDLNKCDVMESNDIISINNVVSLAEKDKGIPSSLADQLDEISIPLKVSLPGINEPRTETVEIPKRKNDITVMYNNSGIYGHKHFNTKKLLKLHRPLNCHKEDYFKHVVSKPLYRDAPKTLSPLMREIEIIRNGNSLDDKRLNAVLHLFATTHEAYLYMSRLEYSRVVSNKLLAVFKFTAAVKNVYLDHYMLHALTDAGIETFSLPFNMFMQVGDCEMFSEFEDSIKLLGIHPFIGVVDFAVTENYMMVFASPNQKCALNWTVYYLTLPNAIKIYRDVEFIATTYKGYDESSYLDMVTAMMTILRISVKFRINVPAKDTDELQACYKQRFLECLYMFLRSNDVLLWKNAFLICCEDDSDILEIIDYIILQMEKNAGILRALQYLIKKWIRKNRWSIEEPVIDGIVDRMQIGPDYPIFYVYLVLSEPLFVIVAGCKIEPILEAYYHSRTIHKMEEVLAIGSLKCALGRTKEAEKILNDYFNSKNSSNKIIIEYLVKYHTILFQEDEDHSLFFSTFALFCMEHLHIELGCALARIVQENIHDETVILSNIDALNKGKTAFNGSRTLQTYLEQMYDQRRRNDDVNLTLCLQMLVTSYVMSLNYKLENSTNTNDHNYSMEYIPMFSKEKLPDFLKLLPAVEGLDFSIIRKLQDLVNSELLTDDMKDQMKQLLRKCDERTQIHVTILLMPVEKAVRVLVEICPEALLQYGKDVIDNYDDEDSDDDMGGKWQILLTTLQEKYMQSREMPANIYKKIVEDTLDYLARDLNANKFRRLVNRVLPSLTKEHFVRYTELSERVKRSNFILSVVRNTGQQLMADTSSILQ